MDAWFTSLQAVRGAAREVAAEMQLDENCLNDAAKAFVPANAGYEIWQALSHLTTSTIDARTLLPVKASAARTGEDATDVRFLASRLGLGSAHDVLAVILE